MKYKKELDDESKIVKYKNLVGKYLYKAPNVYKKIVSVDRVSAGHGLQLSNYGLIEDFEIEEHLTSKENFEKACQNCMDLIKEVL